MFEGDSALMFPDTASVRKATIPAKIGHLFFNTEVTVRRNEADPYPVYLKGLGYSLDDISG